MRPEVQQRIIERLLARDTAGLEREAHVPVALYRSAERLDAERRVLFRNYPIPIGHVSELPKPGDILTHDATGVPIVAVRTRSGQVLAFANVCRHRGARLAHGPCNAKAFVCRYHGWSYDLDGRLLHVPGQELFPSLDPESMHLVRLPVACAHGLIWVVPARNPDTSLDIRAHLGAIDDDLDAFGLATHHVYRRATSSRPCNWKLVVDAFLEGYHVRSLHRDSLYRFFGEINVSIDILAPHIRSVGARKTLRDALTMLREQWDIRAFGTPFYYIFPCTILVAHPDFFSLVTLIPESVDRTSYMHLMLVPALPSTDAEHRHWEKSFQLLEETVFQKEDLAIAEDIQKGLGADAYDHFVLGGMEYPIRVFHDTLDQALRAHGCEPDSRE